MATETDPLVPVTIQLPASVLDELSTIVAAASPFLRCPSRAAAVKGALGAFLVHARAAAPTPAPAAPIARPRSRALVPPLPVQHRRTA